MSPFALICILVGLTALLAWINDRIGKLPTSIGVMFGGLAIAIVLILLDTFLVGIDGHQIRTVIRQIDFGALLINMPASEAKPGSGSLLGLLLFATAIRIEPSIFKRIRIWLITWMATGGVLITALGTAALLMVTITLIEGQRPPFIYMLLFAAILAPTDPVAVMDLLRTAGVSGKIRDVIGGEALFNDAASIVLYLLLVGILTGKLSDTSTGFMFTVFAIEVAAGIGVGLAVGGVASLLIRTARRTIVVVLVTIAAALGTCILTPMLHGSVPLASVACGLLIGRIAIARRPSKELETTDFWWVIENALTTIIFLLVGLELTILNFNYYSAAFWGLCAVPLLFGSRLVALLIPMFTMKMLGFKWILTRGQVGLMTWCGLRGTVSLAMAVAIPVQLVDELGRPLRERIISGTFAVVLVTLIVQGLSLARVAKRLGETSRPQTTDEMQ